MGDVVDLPGPEELSDLDKQYLELEKQKQKIRDQNKQIRDKYE